MDTASQFRGWGLSLFSYRATTQNHHLRVRYLDAQPGIPAFGKASQETREWAGNPDFSRIRFGLRTPALPDMRRKSPKVSGLYRKYSRFGETIGGDGFDQDCRPVAFGVDNRTAPHGDDGQPNLSQTSPRLLISGRLSRCRPESISPKLSIVVAMAGPSVLYRARISAGRFLGSKRLTGRLNCSAFIKVGAMQIRR